MEKSKIRATDLRIGDVCVLQCPTGKHACETLTSTFRGIKTSAELLEEMAKRKGLVLDTGDPKEQEAWHRIRENPEVRQAIFIVKGLSVAFEVGKDGRITDGLGREITILAAAHPGRG